MDDNQSLNFEAIANECGIFALDNIDDVIKKILGLDEKYESFNLIKIYNYFLSICNNPEILMNIIRCADRFRDKSTMPYLVDILLMKKFTGEDIHLKEKYSNLRAMCAKAISNYRDTDSVTPLLNCLNNKDENYKVRLACADALGKIGDKYAVVPLIEVIKDEDEKSIYVKESAASALGLIGDTRAVGPLVSILEAQKGIMSKFTFLKERIIEALGKMRLEDDERVFNALKNSLVDDSPQIRINTIEAIMNSDNPEAFDTIKNCLGDEDDEVKKNALIALYNLRGREVLDEIATGDNYTDFLKLEAVSLINEYENEDGEVND